MKSSPSADRIEKLSLQIDEFLGSLTPRPKLSEAIVAMLAMCTYKIETEMPEMTEVLEPLTQITTLLLQAHIIEDIRETN